ncbi:DNA helicase UvrD [Nissabacter sp. SGAir0207]|uniref:DNA helicase UvrD n=1 Tax=Nissabacter sp. SGAir0207 TaxID=2126321 RepID=UPI0010CCC8E4|nr:DNA helicase UvrD [Nissabacter sp. SGAir0207]QCR38648.1 DNA helicase UvrD [Nissabacter sp. SGAir0207]
MDKRVVFAVAGSGKTTLLKEQLQIDSRALILAHTNNNERHLLTQIVRKFGYVPEGIRVMTWFEFLHGFCCRPFLQQQLSTRGLSFSDPPQRVPRSNPRHFQDSGGRLYHRRLALMLMQKEMLPAIRTRLARFYDQLLIDEVQDFAGHDFNFLMELCAANVSILMAGDFYQHTFDTSRDGNTNATLHDNIGRYESHFRAAGVLPDHYTLSKTWRCSETVCNFITTHLNIPIEAQIRRETLIETVTDAARATALHADQGVIKLFYREHHRYGCHSINWGLSKGLDHYQDVCIVLGIDHWRRLNEGTLNALPPSSRNKLYVACSRARGNIYFVPESLLRAHRV